MAALRLFPQSLPQNDPTILPIPMRSQGPTPYYDTYYYTYYYTTYWHLLDC